MDFGIGIATGSDSWKLAQRAEELGFTHAWFFDTQMITGDCFVAMAAAALKTSRIRLGTGVLVPSNRIAAVTANAFATLNGMAPGRIDFGIGTGFSARRAMGARGRQARRNGRIYPCRLRPVEQRDRRDHDRGQAAENPFSEPGDRPDQHQGPNPTAYLRLRTPVASLDR